MGRNLFGSGNFNYGLTGQDAAGIINDCYQRYPAQFEYLERVLHGRPDDEEAFDTEFTLAYNTTYARLMRDLTTRPDLAGVLENALDNGVRIGMAVMLIALHEESINIDFLEKIVPQPNVTVQPDAKKDYEKNVNAEFREDPLDSSKETSGRDERSQREIRREALGFNSKGESSSKQKTGRDMVRNLRDLAATKKEEKADKQRRLSEDEAQHTEDENSNNSDSDSETSNPECSSDSGSDQDTD